MTSPAIAQHITQLVEAWEEFADESADLMFLKTFYNDLLIVGELVHDAVVKNKRLSQHDKQVISNFNSLLNTSDIEVSFIRTFYPSQFASLQSATVEPSSGRYDLIAINQTAQDMLSEIRHSSYLLNLCQELEQVCHSSFSDTQERIRTLIHALLVRITELSSTKILKKQGLQVISQTFLKLHLEEIINALSLPPVSQAFARLMQQFEWGFKQFVQGVVAAGTLSLKERAAILAKNLTENNQETSSRIGVFFVRRMFDDVVFSQLVYHSFCKIALGV